jgi:hypothetical protein
MKPYQAAAMSTQTSLAHSYKRVKLLLEAMYTQKLGAHRMDDFEAVIYQVA